MQDTPTDTAGPAAEGAGCALRTDGHDAQPSMPHGGASGGPCCGEDAGAGASLPPDRGARHARAAAGLMFLAVAGALAPRRLPGDVALWPAALVPTWFGVSHLVAGVTGYRGCPELGAIPSVMLGRPVPTRCEPWSRIDRRLGSARGLSCALLSRRRARRLRPR